MANGTGVVAGLWVVSATAALTGSLLWSSSLPTPPGGAAGGPLLLGALAAPLLAVAALLAASRSTQDARPRRAPWITVAARVVSWCSLASNVPVGLLLLLAFALRDLHHPWG